MEQINITGTDETPNITFDPESGHFELSGKSLPEDVTTFYNPILDWLDKYSSKPSSETKVTFKMDYFNTASSKILLDILMKLEEIHEKGNNVLISWYFRADDEDMEEAGEEYGDLVDVPFEQVKY